MRRKTAVAEERRKQRWASLSINECFVGCECHHFLDELPGICIPASIHRIGHSHDPKNYEKLRIVNKKVLEWLNERPIENMLVIQDFTSRLEAKFGKSYFD